jgi:hypothetical protein
LRIVLLALLLALSFSKAYSRTENQEFPSNKHFIGSSLFMLANFASESPSFYQLNYGYRISPKDIIIIEAITWKYYAPVGIPYGPSLGSSDERFPGYVRDIGIGLAYQRFLYKGLYTTFHATPFLQQYFTKEKKKIQTGFQLFLTLRLGYHFKLLNNSFFIEPSVAFTHWPINTNLPASFKKVEDRWPNYFLFEPGIHFGFNF